MHYLIQEVVEGNTCLSCANKEELLYGETLESLSREGFEVRSRKFHEDFVRHLKSHDVHNVVPRIFCPIHTDCLARDSDLKLVKLLNRTVFQCNKGWVQGVVEGL